MRFRLNGATMQESNTNQLIFGVPELIEFVSQSITLEPGGQFELSGAPLESWFVKARPRTMGSASD